MYIVKVHGDLYRVCVCYSSQFWLFSEIRKEGEVIVVSERVDTKGLIEISIFFV